MYEEIFSARIIEIGNEIAELLKGGMLITFKDNAPVELRKYCHIIDIIKFSDNLKVGDILTINNIDYSIIEVGEVANKTLCELGHTTFVFNCDIHEEPMAGSIYLEGTNAVPSLDIETNILIRRKINVS